MHDAKGRELKVGDVVLIAAVVKTLHGGEDYCNVGAESVFGRRPDGLKETFHAINTGVMLRANAGDENDLEALALAARAEAEDVAGAEDKATAEVKAEA